mgnify:CR=1 FL=1
MIISMFRVPVAKGREKDFEARFQGRARLVDKMKGFIEMAVLRPLQEGSPYIVYSRWESLEDFRAWTESPEFRRAHEAEPQGPPLTCGEPKLELYEVALG